MHSQKSIEEEKGDPILDEVSNLLIDDLKALEYAPQTGKENMIEQKCQDLFNHLFISLIDTTYTAKRRLFAFKEAVEPFIVQQARNRDRDSLKSASILSILLANAYVIASQNIVNGTEADRALIASNSMIWKSKADALIIEISKIQFRSLYNKNIQIA